MARMKMPPGCKSVSWGGNEYTADKKGFADVPDEAVSDLSSHGLKVADTDQKTDQEEEK